MLFTDEAAVPRFGPTIESFDRVEYAQLVLLLLCFEHSSEVAISCDPPPPPPSWNARTFKSYHTNGMVELRAQQMHAGA